MRNAQSNILGQRHIYHATPLHYLPLILKSGELLSKRLIGYNMSRPTARKRDMALGLDGHVHCSLIASTPLTVHKASLGYPHVVLQLNSEKIDPRSIAILPYSTKAWRSKWQCQPVTGEAEMHRLLNSFDGRTRNRGLEILIKDRLPLGSLTSFIVTGEVEADLLRRLASNLIGFQEIPIVVRNGEPYRVVENSLSAIADYFNYCTLTRTVPMPPTLPFD